MDGFKRPKVAEKKIQQKSTKIKTGKIASKKKQVNKNAKLWQKTRRKWYKIEKNTSKKSQKFFLSRFGNLRFVRKKTIIWLSFILLILLGNFGQIWLTNRSVLTVKNDVGENYTEGVVDKITTLNPLFAATDSEKMLSKLVFPSLLKYDAQNNLAGNLAKTWTTKDGKKWQIVLRDAFWSDGEKISADDVIFTIEQIKKPENLALQQKTFAQISAKKINEKTVEFLLASSAVNFPHSLLFGIFPAHIFRDQKINLRDFSGLNKEENISGGILQFNSKTTNSRTTTVKFSANQKYFGEKMKLRSFSVKVYSNEADLATAWKSGAINAIADASPDLVEKILQDSANNSKKSRSITTGKGDKILAATTRDGVFAIFNNDSEKMQNKNLRAALLAATDRESLRKLVAPKNAENLTPQKLETPISRGIFAEVDKLEQAKFDQKKASELLDGAGWKIGKNNLREKKGEILTLKIVTPQRSTYKKVAEILAADWKKIGIKTEILAVEPSEIQTNFLIPRAYDVLLYQLHLGNDPDMAAYWSSFQADAHGLNLANWRNNLADAFLSAGLRQINPINRKASYLEFVKKWLNDSASMALYQPNFYYISRANISGFGEFSSDNGITISDLSDRTNSLSNWTTARKQTRKTP